MSGYDVGTIWVHQLWDHINEQQKDVYIEYTKDTLNGIIRRINGYMDAMGT